MGTRYIAEHIRPCGTPVVGTHGVLVREYANDRNALRFMHRHLTPEGFPAGQYVLSTYPRSTETNGPRPARRVGHLYKLVGA